MARILGVIDIETMGEEQMPQVSGGGGETEEEERGVPPLPGRRLKGRRLVHARSWQDSSKAANRVTSWIAHKVRNSQRSADNVT